MKVMSACHLGSIWGLRCLNTGLVAGGYWYKIQGYDWTNCCLLLMFRFWNAYSDLIVAF